MPLVLPPTVTGYYLIVLLGRHGLIGETVYNVTGWTVAFTWQAAVIAATVLGGAPVLLLDEPLIGLDPLGQRELRAIVADLRSDGHAILVSTHLLESAAAIRHALRRHSD